jgi:hypothetical protein
LENLIIVIALGLIQAGMAAGGIYVSLKTVPENQHKYWIGGFIAAAIIGIGLSAWSAHLADKSQATLTQALNRTEKEVADAKRESTEANGKLTGIQSENTYQRGQVDTLLKVIDSNRSAELKFFASQIEQQNKKLYEVKHEPAAMLKSHAQALYGEMEQFLKTRESTAPKVNYYAGVEQVRSQLEKEIEYDQESVRAFTHTFQKRALAYLYSVQEREIKTSPGVDLRLLENYLTYPTNRLGMERAIGDFGRFADSIQ